MTGSSSDARGLATASYTLTVSGDPRFLETVRALTARTAETVGVAPGDAGRLADAIGALMEALVQAVASPTAPDVLQVRFDVNPTELRVEAACEPPEGRRGDWTFERGLAEAGRLDVFRTVAPAAEFGVHGRHLVCRLSCAHAR